MQDPDVAPRVSDGEGHGLQTPPTGLQEPDTRRRVIASSSPSTHVQSPSSNPISLQRLPSDKDLASDPPLDHEREDEAPQIPSPPDSDPSEEPATTTPKRRTRASTHGQQTPVKSLLFSPEKAAARPITSHDPSPLKNPRSAAFARPITKPPNFGRDFKRTISAPTTTEQDSFGEDPQLPPRRRIERYLTTSPKGWAFPTRDGEDDEGEVTDQESVKESATVSQSLQMDDMVRGRGSPHSPLMRISEVEEKTSPLRAIVGLDPTQLNTSPPVPSSVGLPVSSPTRPRSRLSSPGPTATRVGAPTHGDISPSQTAGKIPSVDQEDVPITSSLDGNFDTGRYTVTNHDESESNNPLFTNIDHPPSPSPYERTRFGNMPSSTASSNRLNDDSQLLGAKSEKDFGTDEASQAEINLPATQVIRQSQATVSAPSSPSVDLRISVPTVPLALPTKPTEPASATSSSSTRLTIPQNRLLTRRKQQSEASLPHKHLEIVPPATRALSSGSRTPREVPRSTSGLAGYEPTQVSQCLHRPLAVSVPTPVVDRSIRSPSVPRTAPLPRIAGLEPTQVSQAVVVPAVTDPSSKDLTSGVLPSSIPANTDPIPQSLTLDTERRSAVKTLAVSQPPRTDELSSEATAGSIPVRSVTSHRQPQTGQSSLPQPAPLSPVDDRRDASAALPQQYTNKTLPPTPPPRPTATRKYGTPKKGKRMSIPSMKVKEAQEAQEDVDMMSDISSGTTISRDPDDETFRPGQKHKKGTTGKIRAKTAVKEPVGSESESEKDHDEDSDAMGHGDRKHVGRQRRLKQVTTRVARPKSRKRKKASRSGSKDGTHREDSDGGSSGTTPDDEEDDTYQPFGPKCIKGLTGRVMPPRAAGRSTRASSASTEQRPRKRSKLKGSTGKRQPTDIGGSKAGLSGRDTRDASLSTAPSAHSEEPHQLQIMGYWKGSKQYFVGTVRRPLDGRFHVRFADGLEAEITIDQMRLFDIRPGDEIKSNERGASKKSLKVVEAYDGGDRGIKVLSGPNETTYISLKYLCVPAAIINRDWNDRLVEPRQLGLANSAELVRSGPKTSTGLSGKIFLITINEVDRDGAIRKPLEASIVAQGGRIAEDWTELFESSDDGFWSKLSTSCTPFLLVHGPEGAKPKTLAALAAGIPCLSADFISHHAQRVRLGRYTAKTADLQGVVDWRAYLVSPGRSSIHGQLTSQMIDPNWGEDSWSPSSARNPRRFLAGKKILFVISQRSDSQHLVPLLRVSSGGMLVGRE